MDFKEQAERKRGKEELHAEADTPTKNDLLWPVFSTFEMGIKNNRLSDNAQH